jgi:hypothetical protein
LENESNNLDVDFENLDSVEKSDGVVKSGLTEARC